MSNTQKSLGQDSDWIIDSVIDHSFDISNYNHLPGSSYIKLPKELDYQNNSLINIQNIKDNECFKWYLFRYFNPEDCNPGRITKRKPSL